MSLIMVIDDDWRMRRVVAHTLERAGYETLECKNGLEGINLQSVRRSDLLITDIMMPEMDGFEILRSLRRNDPALPILVISGCHDCTPWPDYLGFAGKLGAAAILAKPFRASALIETVQGLLRASEALRPREAQVIS